MTKLTLFLYILFIMLSEVFVFAFYVPSNIYSITTFVDTIINEHPTLPSNTSIFSILDWLSFIVKLIIFIFNLAIKFMNILFNIIITFVTVITYTPLLLSINIVLLLILALIIMSWIHIAGSGIDL